MPDSHCKFISDNVDMELMFKEHHSKWISEVAVLEFICEIYKVLLKLPHTLP